MIVNITQKNQSAGVALAPVDTPNLPGDLAGSGAGLWWVLSASRAEAVGS
jgi:hypothetical protein